MLKIDGAYLYGLGQTMRSLKDLPTVDTDPTELFYLASSARPALQGLLYASVFKDAFRASHRSGAELLRALDSLAPETGMPDWETPVAGWKIAPVKRAFVQFETIMTAELQSSNLFYASQKGGYDTAQLIEHGEALFPNDLPAKVPSCIPDVQAAARCIAFELPTAAGFHLHRANEAVLLSYWNAVTDYAPRPRNNNMGGYLAALEKGSYGSPAVLAHLKSIKDFHRNPLMHPEQTLESTDQAIDLLSAIRCSIGYMLNEIPIIEAPAIVQTMSTSPAA